MSDWKVNVSIPTKVRGVTDQKSLRYPLHAGRLTPGKDRCYLAVTDAQVAAIVPCEGTADRERMIPGPALPNTKGGDFARLNGEWQTKKGGIPDKVEGRFPRVEQVLPAVDCGANDWLPITIDAASLAALAEAIGGDGRKVTLMIPRGFQWGEGEAGGTLAVVGPHGIGAVQSSDGIGHDSHRDSAERYEVTRKHYVAARRAADVAAR